MSAARRTAALVVGPLCLTACTVAAADLGLTAECGPPGRPDNPVLTLMAQAVPSAQLLPCIRAVPAGWTLSDPDVRSGRAGFALGSMDEGLRAVEVEVSASCDTRGASEVPTDQPGTRRSERASRVADGYAGVRFYEYDGGCTTYRFDLHGQTRAEVLAQVSVALGFATRAAVADEVRRDSDGRDALVLGGGS